MKVERVLVDFSVTSPLCHLPCQPTIGLKTRLRDFQTIFLNQLNIPAKSHGSQWENKVQETWLGTWMTKTKEKGTRKYDRWKRNLLLCIEVFYPQIFIPNEYIIISCDNIRMQKSFCIPPAIHWKVSNESDYTKFNSYIKMQEKNEDFNYV